MVESKTFESIDKEAQIGNIGEYEVKLKYNENNKIVIEYIQKATGTRITYTLNPVGYTNVRKVDILLNINSNKAIKSITKPDGLLLYPEENNVGIDYTVTNNGKYKFIIEDIEGTKTEKEVIVDTIDTLAPKDFEITVETIREGIVIEANTEDAEANENNVCSGIEKYEYYVKKQEDTDYTKYDKNKIQGLSKEGRYYAYVIVYDKAQNKRQSQNRIIDLFVSPTNYGQGEKVNYEANGVKDWKIFYKNESLGQTYIVTSDALPAEKIPQEAGMMTITGSNRACWETIPDNTGASSIDKEIATKFLLSWATYPNASTTYDSAKCVATLMNTDIWKDFASKEGLYAIGSPTFSMWVASYNEWYPKNKIYSKLTAAGYSHGKSQYEANEGGYITNITAGAGNKLYFTNDCTSYLLASPASRSSSGILSIRHVDSKGISLDSCRAYSSLRPVVSIPSELLTYNSDTNSWDIK